MPEDVAALIASLTGLGGESACVNHDRFAADLGALLALAPAQVDVPAYRAALAHGFAYYFWRWDPRAVQHHAAVESAIIRWAAVDEPDLDLLCELADFLFFIGWCFEESSTRQCQQVMRGMAAAAAAFARTSLRTAPARPPRGVPVHVLWLAMYAGSDNPMAVVDGWSGVAGSPLHRPEGAARAGA